MSILCPPQLLLFFDQRLSRPEEGEVEPRPYEQPLSRLSGVRRRWRVCWQDGEGVNDITLRWGGEGKNRSVAFVRGNLQKTFDRQ